MIDRNVSQRDYSAAPGVRHGAHPYVVYHEFDGPAEVSTTLAHAIADATGYDVTDVGFGLNEFVDPDALDRLFAPRSDGTSRANGSLAFSLWDCHVTVDGTGRIVVARTRPHRSAQYRRGAGYR